MSPAARPSPAPAALLVTGGALGALVPVLHPGHGPGYYTHPGTATAHLLLFAAVLALSLGLPGLVRDGAGGRTAAAVGAALYFVGAWCLDGTHGLIDGAVLPTLASAQPEAGPLLASGVASQALLARGPMGAIVNAGTALFAGGSLLLGGALVRAGRLARPVGWGVALAWALVPLSFALPAIARMALMAPYLALVAAGAALALAVRRAAPASRAA